MSEREINKTTARDALNLVDKVFFLQFPAVLCEPHTDFGGLNSINPQWLMGNKENASEQQEHQVHGIVFHSIFPHIVTRAAVGEPCATFLIIKTRIELIFMNAGWEFLPCRRAP